MRQFVSVGVLVSLAGLANGQVVENFDNVGLLPALGWSFQNSSQNPIGPGWFQGDPLRFPAQSGAPSSYIAADLFATAGTAAPETISAWLVSPVVLLGTASQISFYTRTESPVSYADRLQVRLSTVGEQSVIGTTPTDVGTFTTVLLDINPSYSVINGYPTTWTLYTISVPPLSTTACRVAFRYFVEQGGPLGSRSNYIGLDSVLIGNANAAGGCCLPNATCIIATESQCAGAGGVYRGDQTNCAAACPVPADLWIESGDAGNLPGTAQAVNGTGSLGYIRGALTAGDADMYRFQMCSPTQFSATTVGGSNIDTQLFLFAAAGTGISFNDDDPTTGLFQSTISSTFTSALPAGEVLLAVSQFDNDPLSGGQQIWLDQPNGIERAPDGPGAAGAATAWSGTTNQGGAYAIALTGACFLGGGATCYANCDQSTVAPVLNVADFTCFLQRFAAGSTYANCDGSTVAPVLNVADFTCFLQRFAAGCP